MWADDDAQLLLRVTKECDVKLLSWKAKKAPVEHVVHHIGSLSSEETGSQFTWCECRDRFQKSSFSPSTLKAMRIRNDAFSNVFTLESVSKLCVFGSFKYRCKVTTYRNVKITRNPQGIWRIGQLKIFRFHCSLLYRGFLEAYKVNSFNDVLQTNLTYV